MFNPGHQDIEIFENTQFSRSIRLKAGPSYTDWTGCTFKLVARQTYPSPKVLELTSANGDITIDGEWIRIEKAAAGLLLRFVRAVYALWVYPPGHPEYPLLVGDLIFNRVAQP